MNVQSLPSHSQSSQGQKKSGYTWCNITQSPPRGLSAISAQVPKGVPAPCLTPVSVSQADSVPQAP